MCHNSIENGMYFVVENKWHSSVVVNLGANKVAETIADFEIER